MLISELYKIYKESTGVCTNTKVLENGNMFFALKGPNFNANTLAKEAIDKGAIVAVIDDSTYQNKNCILVDNVLETLQQLANFHRKQFDIPVIGITGSNGKTTTKELIASVLESKYKVHFTKGNFNNHIGVPLTLLAMPLDTEMAIIEMGANHIGEIALLCEIAEPNFGIITNIGKAHLEGFGSIEGVAKGKSELFLFVLKSGKNIFVNTLDAHLSRMASRFQNPVTFPQKNDFTSVQFISSRPLVVVKYDNVEINTNLIGEYNFTNIAAAICIGNYFNVEREKIKVSLENYFPTNNRSQIVKKGTNTVFLDAYNANPSSMKVAIENFISIDAEKKILILGDMFELGNDSIEEHEKIGVLTDNVAFDQVLLVGKDMLYAAQNNNNAIHFEDKNQLSEYLGNENISNATFLIKGSRGMALENILEIL